MLHKRTVVNMTTTTLTKFTMVLDCIHCLLFHVSQKCNQRGNMEKQKCKLYCIPEICLCMLIVCAHTSTHLNAQTTCV